MKAFRLRAGLVVLAVAIIGIGVIQGPDSAVAAEEDLTAALEDYAAGRYEEALVKLREYVASNPGEEEIYAVLRDADEKLLLRVLAREGEDERLLKYLMDKARPAARAERLDPAKIQEMVQTAVTDPSLDRRRAAGLALRTAGDLAVPYLFPYLARSDADVVVYTMFALQRIGVAAVDPLVEVLESDNARMAGNAAAVLGDIGDENAVPALLRLKETTEDAAAREKAEKALAKIGGAMTAMSATDAYTKLGQMFYANDPNVITSFDNVRNLWRWENDDLARYEIPSFLYPYQRAEQMAADALMLSPVNKDAQALLVRALLAQQAEADALQRAGGEAPEALASVAHLAQSQGFGAATEALRGALQDQDWDVAVEAIGLVTQTYGNESLANHPLGAALVAPDKRVNYAAAIAALHMSPKSGLANADKVVSLGAEAAAERAVRQVLVIDDREDTRDRLKMDLAHSGFVTSDAKNGARGVALAKMSPTLDVIVVRADLGDPRFTIPSERLTSAIMVLDELKNDVRTKDVRVLVLLEETDEAKVDALRDFFESKYGDEVVGFLTVPLDTATIVDAVAAAAEAGDLNPDRERANELAEKAAMAFANTDFSCRTFDLGVAVAPLASSALEGPTPELRLAAVKALGNLRAGGIEALTKVLMEGEGEEIQAAAATALGNVLSVQPSSPDAIQALIDAASGEGEVATAALKALGRARGLSPVQRLELFKTHRLPVAERAGM